MFTNCKFRHAVRGVAAAGFGCAVALLATPAAAFDAAATMDAMQVPPGPTLQVSEATARDALICTETGQTDAEPGAVLLVHGTGLTPASTWADIHVPTLAEAGYNVCTVELPNKALGDAQIAAEYVVHAVRMVDSRFPGGVDVIGHSQGSIVARWAMKFWPDIAPRIDDFISMAGSNHGTAISYITCAQTCPDALAQQSPPARFIAALNADDETPEGPDYTSIYSFTDEIVITSRRDPSPALDGATNIAVQSVCPYRPTTHIGILVDAVGYGLLRDALDHDGTADPARVDSRVCWRNIAADFRGLTAARETLESYAASGSALFAGGIRAEDNDEPPLRDYARDAFERADRDGGDQESGFFGGLFGGS